jgi:1-deoxy-D-xylulose-5-phosphate synthase
VELTIALHRVFDSPRDKLVWDVGHQSYPHKVLTGRKGAMSSLRQYKGLCGFPDPAESPHDAFCVGHASTSVSAALGMALARDMARDDCHVIAVIGDGAMGGGMAFEALNHAGQMGTRLIVVLNDNGMAISPSIGALAKILKQVRGDPRYQRMKEDAKRVITSLPLGTPAWQASKQLKNHIKRAILPVTLWEQLGFEYIGPLDGHNIEALEAALKLARNTDGPVLVHVITKKGKGYPPHGVPRNGERPSSAPSYSSVFGDTVVELLQRDPRLVVITAAMVEGTGLGKAARQFPGRVIDVGICEQHAVTMAAGMASRGLVPIVAVYSTFLQRAYDQVIHDVCLQNLPVVFALDRAGIVGDDGKTHQGAFDVSYLSCIPNMVVSAPKDEEELRHLLYTATVSGRPMAVRYPRGRGWGVPRKPHLEALPIGKGELLRQGNDVAIVACGVTVVPALEAARLLSDEGIECSVVNARFIKPLDAELILEAGGGAGHVLTVEENARFGGLGSAVMVLFSDAGLGRVNIKCLGLPDHFIEHGPQQLFRSQFGLDADGIARAARDMLGRRAPQVGATRESKS